MANENQNVNSEREVYQDRKGNTHTRVSHSTETVHNPNPNEYRDGYTHGRIAENRYQEDRQVVRDNNNAARGLLLGIILTSLVGLAAGLYYYFGQRDNEPVTAPVVVPVPGATQSPVPTPTRTVIERERTIDRSPTVIPVPQATTSPAPTPTINIQQAPSSPAPQSNFNPDIDINVPSNPSPSTTRGEAPSIRIDNNNTAAPQGSRSETRIQTPSDAGQAPSTLTSPGTSGATSDTATPSTSSGTADTTSGSTDTTSGSDSTTGTTGSGSSTGSTGASGQ